MSDTATQQAADTTVDNTSKAGIPVKMGSVQRVQMNFQQPNNTKAEDENTGTGQQVENTTNTNAAATDTDNTDTTAQQKETAVEINEDQLKAYLEKQGIKYEGIEKLKEKANYEPSNEPTVEQKEAAAKAKEKRMLDAFIAGGGTAEQYVAIKGVAEVNETEFAISNAKAELIKAGYTQEEAEVFLKENYHQIDDAELEQYGDESDKAFKKRTKEFFAKQLANLSSPIKAKAAGILADLHSAIESEDLQVQNEQQLSSKIDEQFKTLPRKFQIEIGEIGGKTVSPVDYDVSETDYSEVQAMLKDPAQRNNFLYNEDGSLNIANISQALTKAKMFDSAAKVSFLSGIHKATTDFQKVFPAGSAQELGVGGSQQRTNVTNGQLGSFGKPKRVQPQRQ